jgi:hypothetical protein
MEQVALVVIDALIVGQFPCIEVPDGIDHDVELFFVDLEMLAESIYYVMGEYLSALQIL